MPQDPAASPEGPDSPTPPPPPGDPAGAQPGWGPPPPGWGPPPPGWGPTPPPYAEQSPYPGPGFPPPGYGYPQFQPPRPAKPGTVELRPLLLSDLLEGTFATLRRAPMPTLVNAAVVQLVLGILGVALMGWLFAPTMGLEEALVNLSVEAEDLGALEGALGSAFPYPWYLYVAAGLLAAAAQLAAYALVAGPATVAAMRATLGRPTSWRQGYGLSRKALPKLVGYQVLLFLAPLVLLVPMGLLVYFAGMMESDWGLAAMAPLLLFGFAAAIAMTWVAVRLTLVPALLASRPLTIRGALGTSWRLTRGSWWRVFGIVLVVCLVIAVLSGIVSSIFALAESVPGGSGGAWFLLVLSTVVNVLVTAMGTVILQVLVTLLQVDLRIRHERLDQALLAELGDPAAHPVPGHDAADLSAAGR